jgi:hypothetical protein
MSQGPDVCRRLHMLVLKHMLCLSLSSPFSTSVIVIVIVMLALCTADVQGLQSHQAPALHPLSALTHS